MGLRRGDIAIGAPPGDFSKPRPATILQEEVYPETELVTVALITSDRSRQPHLRIGVEPTEANGLRKPSEIMIDNIQTFRVSRIGDIAGCIDNATVDRVKVALAVFFGF